MKVCQSLTCIWSHNPAGLTLGSDKFPPKWNLQKDPQSKNKEDKSADETKSLKTSGKQSSENASHLSLGLFSPAWFSIR